MNRTLARPRAAAALVATLALLTTLPAAPAMAASPTACRVKNLDTGITKASLQRAVGAASARQRLTVKGTCRGITRIGKDLRISGIRTRTSGQPTLDGDDKGSVVTVAEGAKVTIATLTITDGTAGQGGGIFTAGDLSLRGVLVRGNVATARMAAGGGIHSTGPLKLQDTIIRGNTAAGGGGGVFSSSTMAMTGASVIRDSSGRSGGGAYIQGSLVISGTSAIRYNTAGAGGGLYGDLGSTLYLEGASEIHHNTATDGTGGGVDLSFGTLAMNGTSTIHHNSAVQGGGVHNLSGTVESGGTSAIHHNQASLGGGVYQVGSPDAIARLRMIDQSIIRDNIATSEGGGVHDLDSSTILLLDDSTIVGNSKNGVFDADEPFGDFCGDEITDNTPADCVQS